MKLLSRKRFVCKVISEHRIAQKQHLNAVFIVQRDVLLILFYFYFPTNMKTLNAEERIFRFKSFRFSYISAQLHLKLDIHIKCLLSLSINKQTLDLHINCRMSNNAFGCNWRFATARSFHFYLPTAGSHRTENCCIYEQI